MGFFSWKCAKTRRPVMAEAAVGRSPWDFASDVVVLFDNGDRISGRYDGYGGIDDHEGILTDSDPRSWRMVIKKYYEGETFDQLTANPRDPGQGFFYDDDDLIKFFGAGDQG